MKPAVEKLLEAYNYRLIDQDENLHIYRKNRVLVIIDDSENKIITFLINGNRHVRIIKDFKPAQVVEVLGDYSTYSNQET